MKASYGRSIEQDLRLPSAHTSFREFLIDINMQATVLFYGCSYHRNVQSQSSGAERMNYFVASYGALLFVGEDKLLDKYRQLL